MPDDQGNPQELEALIRRGDVDAAVAAVPGMRPFLDLPDDDATEAIAPVRDEPTQLLARRAKRPDRELEHRSAQPICHTARNRRHEQPIGTDGQVRAVGLERRQWNQGHLRPAGREIPRGILGGQGWQ